MIKPKSISWFYENLPQEHLFEDNYINIIKRNYSLSWFIPFTTSNIEKVEILTSKWGDDNEIYGIKRLKAKWKEANNIELWLRFDLTVPLARYVAQNEWDLDFPFKRQQIWKVFRWERPQKCRYREFYQADIDIVWNQELSLFADVEIIYTIYKSLKELSFWDFVININNKKLITWYLESIWVKKIQEVISIIDKKDKLKSIIPMLEDLWINKNTINNILSFINTWEIRNSKEILDYFSKIDNKLIQDWIKDLDYIYKNLINLWVEEKFLYINPSISRGLNYYTWIVFETFIFWNESLWSIASWWRYDNLASNFSKNNFPWVGWSIWLSRLICVLKEIWRVEFNKKTITKVLVLNMWNKSLKNNIEIVKKLRYYWVNTEIYLDSETKIQKQLKYANNKNINYVIIQWEDEIEKGVFQLKNLRKGEQQELNLSLINDKEKLIKTFK